MTEKKKNLIRNLMLLNGSISTQHEFIQNVIETIRETVPEIQHIPLDDIAEDVLNEIIPFYDQYFTEEQLEELNLFFETDIGRLYHKNLILMIHESYNIGERVGKIITNRIIEYKIINENDGENIR